MVSITADQAKALEHVREYCRLARQARYMDGEGTPRLPHIIKVVTELSKEDILEALFYGYEIED